WPDARTIAKGRSLYLENGYLANITSAQENAFVLGLLQEVGKDAWLGGSDSAGAGYRWFDGPEAGTLFWNGVGSGGTPVSGQYSNWGAGEPNDFGWSTATFFSPFAKEYESFLMMTHSTSFVIGGWTRSTSPGKWNDAPLKTSANSFYRLGSVVEYGGSQPVFFTDQRTLRVRPSPQAITFGPLADKTYGDAAFPLTATSSSGLPVSYSSSDIHVATVSGNTVTLVGVGTVTLTASQPGNGTYAPATSASQSLTVGQALLSPTNIVLTSPASLVYDGTTKTYSAGAAGVTGFTFLYEGRLGTVYGPSATAPTNPGDYTVTATSSDPRYGGSRSADFSILPANTPPALGSITDRLAQPNQTQVFALSTLDGETALADLVLAASSDNPTLLPAGSMTFARRADNGLWELTVNPATNATGTANITVVLRDQGGLQNQKTFRLTVEAPATSPFANNVNLTSTASVISVPMPTAALGAMTLEFWIKPASGLSSGTYRVVSKNGPTGKAELAIDLNYTSSTVANLSATLTPSGGFPTTASVDLGNPLGWTHVAMVISSFSVQLFADGTASSSFSLSSSLNWSNLQMVFGNGFRGQLDDIRIYSGVRTGTQINADKSGPALTPYESSLVAYYKLDEGTGTSLADATGRNGSATGGNIAWGPGRSPGAWNFSSGDYALLNDGTSLLLELGGTEGTTLYDQIFVRNGAATLDGIVNLMFIGAYTGPVSGGWHTFDLIWAQNGVLIGDNYRLVFDQPGYTVDTAVVAKDGGQLWQATVREAASQADLNQAAVVARPVLGISKSPGTVGTVEMMYTYTRPAGGSYVGGQYAVNGVRYEVQISTNLVSWTNAAVEPVSAVTAGGGRENATVKVNSGAAKAFLRLKISN
ncbi:MAG: hypothetical protein EBZ83_03675, partial [Verrucomicrobia bacterium]|nr:hypothetical protein [Verrucomicrobiota bacterium]